MGDRGVDLRIAPPASWELTAKPAMVAAGSWRPSRSNTAARIASGIRIMVTLPASW